MNCGNREERTLRDSASVLFPRQFRKGSVWMTVEEYVTRWYKLYRAPRNQRSTNALAEINIRVHIRSSELGKMELDCVTPRDIQIFLMDALLHGNQRKIRNSDRRGKPLSRWTVRKLRQMLKAMSESNLKSKVWRKGILTRIILFLRTGTAVPWILAAYPGISDISRNPLVCTASICTALAIHGQPTCCNAVRQFPMFKHLAAGLPPVRCLASMHIQSKIPRKMQWIRCGKGFMSRNRTNQRNKALEENNIRMLFSSRALFLQKD